MPVRINYKGRCGNNIFQYVTARIFCEKNELTLLDKLECDLLQTKKILTYNEEINSKPIKLTHESFDENDELIPHEGNYYIFDDFFQNCNYINNNYELIKSFFELPSINKNNNDIVLHIRLDDKIHCENMENPTDWSNAELIHPNYYLQILENETFDNVYIVSDRVKYNWEKKYMSYFDKFKPIIINY